jgi:transposase
MGLQMYKRYNENGLDGLKDKERSGRPPDVPKDVILQIRQELEDSILTNKSSLTNYFQ